MQGRMKCDGKIYWNRNKGPSPGSQYLLHVQVAQLCLAVEEDQPCLYCAEKKGQGSEILCHWPGTGKASKTFIVWLSPYQSVVQLSLCPHLAGLVSLPSCVLACAVLPCPGLHLDLPDCLLGPKDCRTHTTAVGEIAQIGEFVLPRGAFVKFWLCYLRLRRDQSFFQINQSLFWLFVGFCWALPLSSAIFIAG